MGYLDDELLARDVALVEEHLRTCSDCGSDLESFRRLKADTHDMQVVSPEDKYWNDYWSNVYNRLERRIGWILISAGTILLGAYGIYRLLVEVFFVWPMPLAVQLGILAVVIGFFTLLVSVVRERIVLARSDKYERIRR
jgi:hypothetical protein